MYSDTVEEVIPAIRKRKHIAMRMQVDSIANFFDQFALRLLRSLANLCQRNFNPGPFEDYDPSETIYLGFSLRHAA